MKGYEPTKPTAVAEEFFYDAKSWFRHSSMGKGPVAGNPAEFATNSGLMNLAEGLSNLAVGLRATYVLLEEIQKQVKQNARDIAKLSGS